MIGTGSHSLQPITLMDVRGPWQVPFRFELYYQSGGLWPKSFKQYPALTWWSDPHSLGRNWTHTLSEAIVVSRPTTESREPEASPHGGERNSRAGTC
jgi:hypothetical protein